MDIREDGGFGQLRELMQSHDPIDGDALMAWLTRVEALDSAHYEAEWAPYLQSFPHHWRTSLITVETVEELEHAAHIAPFARFTFDGSAWSALVRSARAQGKVLGGGVPPGILRHQGFDDEKMAELMRSHALSHIVCLDLTWGNLTPGGIELLAHSPALAHLERLDLCYHYDIKDEGVMVLAQSPYLTRLTYLDLSQTGARSEGVLALAQSPITSRLETLRYRNRIDNQQIAKDFVASASLTRLEHLELSSTRGEDVAAILCSPKAATLHTFECHLRDSPSPSTFSQIGMSPHVARLEHLKFNGAQLDDAHLEALAQGSTLSSLRMLDISHHAITSAGVEALTKATWFPQLETLNLLRTDVDADALSHLATSQGKLTCLRIGQDVDVDLDKGLALFIASDASAHLEHLEIQLSRCQEALLALSRASHMKAFSSLQIYAETIDLHAFEALMMSPAVRMLKTLDIVTVDDLPAVHLCRALAASPHLEHLTTLHMRYQVMDDEALEVLASAPQCASLKSLRMDWERVSSKGLKAFATSPHFANLEELRVDDLSLTPEHMEMLRRSPYLARSLCDQFDPEKVLEW